MSAAALPRLADPNVVRDIEVLSQQECDSVREILYAERDSWVKRQPKVPFYTLGTNSYMDALSKGYDYYLEKIQETNPFLSERFSWLYDRMLGKLGEAFGETFRYDPARALPGFHIFIAHPAFTQLSGTRHYDLQHEPLDWSGLGEIDSKRQMSLTLSISLPSAGSGLMVWNINHLELAEMSQEEREATREANDAPSIHEYHAGTLAIHSGYHEHQIEPLRRYVEGEDRITLQAHTLPVDGEWVVYW